MLTRELAIVEYSGGRAFPDRLSRKQHAGYLAHAERMLAIYRNGAGRTRRELHRGVQAAFADEPDCPARRIGAFCKLLDDASRFDRDRRGQAAKLRREVFRRAAAFHPLVAAPDRMFEHDETKVKAAIAAELNTTWDDIDSRLFADVIEFHRLREFEGYADAAALLARYNVAQTQAALFDAEQMTVWAADDFKTILRYAKLARLMHTIRRAEDGRYVLRFDGPASVLRETRRYGAAMARFLPALLACHNWRMHALLRAPARSWKNRLELSSADGLTSHLPPPEEFDSSLEEAFATRWGAEPRDGWTISREAEILHRGQHAFVPDFAFTHADGRRVLLEIVGFWTPEYVEAKLKTLALFAGEPILLAVAESISKSPDGAAPVAWPEGTIFFKTALKVKEVLERLAARG